MDKLLQWSIVNTKSDEPVDKKKLEQLDPEVIDMILGKPMSTQMLEIMDIIESPEVSIEDKEVEAAGYVAAAARPAASSHFPGSARFGRFARWRAMGDRHCAAAQPGRAAGVQRPRRTAFASRCAAIARERSRSHQGGLRSLVVHAVEPARVQRAREQRRARPTGCAGRRQQLARAREEGGVPAACAGFGKPG
ncbi:hypothetical protein AYI70_g11325 [Smittium culicis]|uniref:Nucleotide exchange factor Fes1 domain-containing protein n=1 Tax=Smittium culicis TaxID=133412 RepID=A0A1R1X2C4_9FUNG|nr:hypothetical protein AYI70_g11325 [Smittium culicis]